MNVDVLPAGTPPSANPISLRAAPRVVDEGENTTLTWNTGGEVEPNCTLKGGEFGTTGINLPTDNGDDYTGSLQTPVYANTTYTLHCPMSLPADAQAKVEIVPRYFPS
jgi:hypothetical protein